MKINSNMRNVLYLCNLVGYIDNNLHLFYDFVEQIKNIMSNVLLQPTLGKFNIRRVTIDLRSV